MSPIDISVVHARVRLCPQSVPDTMPVSDFPSLLVRHMRRIRASAAGIASEIGMSREAVNNWRNGDSVPSRKHRDKVVACAAYLRLSELETNELLAAVGFEPEFPAEHDRVVPAATSAVGALLDRLQQLRPYPILMLLTPAHLGQPPERAAILADAQRRYGADNVLHLQPPFSLHADAAGYFSALAEQCGFRDVASDYAFEAALSRRLQSGRPLFCLVSRFEQGDPLLRDVLAGILRSLSEMHSGQLHLLICGGAALADLKYQGGDLSLLNIAASASWPDLAAVDIAVLADRAGIAAFDAERVLRLSGGHPLLAPAALALLAEAPGRSDADLIEALATHAPLWQSFLPLLSDATARAAITERLGQERLAMAQPYLLDPLLRRLYWANLVVARRHPDGNWLEWRCAAVRRAGVLILADLDAGA